MGVVVLVKELKQNACVNQVMEVLHVKVCEFICFLFLGSVSLLWVVFIVSCEFSMGGFYGHVLYILNYIEKKC